MIGYIINKRLLKYNSSTHVRAIKYTYRLFKSSKRKFSITFFFLNMNMLKLSKLRFFNEVSQQIAKFLTKKPHTFSTFNFKNIFEQ